MGFILYYYVFFLIFAPQNNRQCTAADYTVVCPHRDLGPLQERPWLQICIP